MRIPGLGLELRSPLRRLRAIKYPSSGLLSPPDWLLELFNIPTGQSSMRIDKRTAMTISAYHSAVRVISEDIAALPWGVFQREGRSRTKMRTHPAWRIVHSRANDWITSYNFRRWIMAQTLQLGNGYAEIQRDGAGRPVALWPLESEKTFPVLVDDELFYETDTRNGTRRVLIHHADVFHVRGLGENPYAGVSVLEHARRSLNLAVAGEVFSHSFFRNLGKLSGVLQHPKQLGEEALDHLEKSIEKAHAGPEAAWRMLVVEEGMQFKETSVTPEQSQLIQARKFTVTEVARWFRIPPHKIADLERATFSNIESEERHYVINTLVPWIVQIEQEADAKLLGTGLRLMGDGDAAELFTKMSVEGLLRGDFQVRMQGYALGRQWGWLSANDVRELEDMNPIDGGDVYLVPLNMIPADQAGEIQGKGSQAERYEPLLARIERAHQNLFRDPAERLAKREIDAILRMGGKNRLASSDFDDFYAEFRGVIRQQFLAPAQAFVETAVPWAASGETEKYATEGVEAAAAAYCARSRHLVYSAGAQSKETIEALAETWRERRAAQLAGEMIAAARAAAVQASMEGKSEIGRAA